LAQSQWRRTLNRVGVTFVGPQLTQSHREKTQPTSWLARPAILSVDKAAEGTLLFSNLRESKVRRDVVIDKALSLCVRFPIDVFAVQSVGGCCIHVLVMKQGQEDSSRLLEQ
jgi:hypothetical protein